MAVTTDYTPLYPNDTVADNFQAERQLASNVVVAQARDYNILMAELKQTQKYVGVDPQADWADGDPTLTDKVGGGVVADKASAGTIVLAENDKIFHVTGTTTINTITPATGDNGPITMIADATWALGGAGNIKAAAGAMTVDRGVTLVYDGTDWYETGRGA